MTACAIFPSITILLPKRPSRPRRDVSEEILDHLDHPVLHAGFPPLGGFLVFDEERVVPVDRREFEARHGEPVLQDRVADLLRLVRRVEPVGVEGDDQELRLHARNAFDRPPAGAEISKMSIAFLMERYELASNRRSKTNTSPWCFRYPSTENSTAECCPIVPSAHFPCRPRPGPSRSEEH